MNIFACYFKDKTHWFFVINWSYRIKKSFVTSSRRVVLKMVTGNGIQATSETISYSFDLWLLHTQIEQKKESSPHESFPSFQLTFSFVEHDILLNITATCILQYE